MRVGTVEVDKLGGREFGVWTIFGARGRRVDGGAGNLYREVGVDGWFVGANYLGRRL